MEAPDLLAGLILAGVLNLFFGQTAFAFLFVVVVPLILLVALYFAKRGKPDDFLIHFVRFHLTPKYLSAGEKAKSHETLLDKRICY
jgi:hypothetical protein